MYQILKNFRPCGAEILFPTQLGPGFLLPGKNITGEISKSFLLPGFFRNFPGNLPGKKNYDTNTIRAEISMRCPWYISPRFEIENYAILQDVPGLSATSSYVR